MGRRVLVGTWWVGFAVCAVLLVVSSMKASNPPDRLPDVQGAWDGYFLTSDGGFGGVQSDTLQDFRRLAGEVALFDLESGGLLNSINFNATLTGAGFITGHGVSGPNRVVFQSALGPFAGLGADAVQASAFQIVPRRGDALQVDALLLHPFASAGPDISGDYSGPFVSVPDPYTGDSDDSGFTGTGRMVITPRNSRGYFGGEVGLFLEGSSEPFLRWPFLATTNADQRVVWVAHGRLGRILYDGAIVPDADAGTRLDGVFRLALIDGRRLFNAYNCTINILR